MQETQIRNKGVFFTLFAVMMALSIMIRSRQEEPQNGGRQEKAVQTLSSRQEEANAGQTAGDPQESADAALTTSSEQELPPQVALTFDDGPHPKYTRELLEGLKKRGVTATFFVVGENIPGREDIIEQMARDGHLIGNHTYDHANMACMTADEICEELSKTSNLVEDIVGEGTAYVRPPFGNWDDHLDGSISMISVKWTLDTRDWTTRNISEIVNRVVTKVEDDDIILLHDYYDSSVEAALQIVDILLERGYEFVPVEELILE